MNKEMDIFEDWDMWENIETTDQIPDYLKTIEGFEKEWVDVNGFDDYEVSIYGEVYSKITNKILSPAIDENGYYRVALSKNGKSYTKKLHRLVAEAFIPNPNNKPTVNHKDTYKRNNRVVNLEWNTISENVKHAYDNGLIKVPETGRAPKKPVKIVETGEIFDSISDCANYLGVDPSHNHISDCMNGRRKTYKGYHYEGVEHE